MPLPLPNLDTRRWNDLVEEARALIPRYAPNWTDHNLHDPGITLIELLAWRIEQEIYRANRVTARSRRAFLQLLGIHPIAPIAARTVVRVSAPSGSLLPKGTLLEATTVNGRQFSFSTLNNICVCDKSIETFLVDDGTNLVEQTRNWREGRPIFIFGSDPQSSSRSHIVKSGETLRGIADQYEASLESIVSLNGLFGESVIPRQGQRLQIPSSTAFYFGFDQALPENQTISFYFCFQCTGHNWSERQRIIKELHEQNINSKPVQPRALSALNDSVPEEAKNCSISSNLDHQSVRLVCEFFDASIGSWRNLSVEEFIDDTRGLTLDGAIHIKIPSAMGKNLMAQKWGYFIRFRFDKGQYEAPPVLSLLNIDSVTVEQHESAWQEFDVASNAKIIGLPPMPGEFVKLRLMLDDNKFITLLEFNSVEASLPELQVISYMEPTANSKGKILLPVKLLGKGDGSPLKTFELSVPCINGNKIDVWTIDASLQSSKWELRDNFNSSRRIDKHVMFDPSANSLCFGDGEHGALLVENARVLVSFEATQASAGNLFSTANWRLLNNPYNSSRPEVAKLLASQSVSLTGLCPASGGKDMESLDEASGRAAEILAAHERLVELSSTFGQTSLDQIPRDEVLQRLPPKRASTLLDFERLALDVPGALVKRAKAWGGIDPRYPHLKAAGAVTLIIIPELPKGRPVPSQGLIKAVHCYLQRRSIIGTRLFVVGPEYVQINILVKIKAKSGANKERLIYDVVNAINTFLDPVVGGPDKLGWPFGRYVYRSEIMQLIDNVIGVDHVLALEMKKENGEQQCGNLCIGRLSMTTPGKHNIEVL